VCSSDLRDATVADREGRVSKKGGEVRRCGRVL
jgi:hypothetical protein